KLHSDGTGDIPLKLSKDDRIAIFAIWPNMRPWKIARPEPMLRSLPDAGRVADILAAALSGARTAPLRSEKTASGAAPSQALNPAH
ncbi:MAG: photosynthetic complex putative assembly protein PuhB, partial [Bosea sp. (in: a-proteobacteria)]